MPSFLRICAIFWIECLHLLRDRSTLSMIILMPILQILLFAYAIDPLPHNVPLALSRPESSEKTLQTIKDIGIFSIVADRLPSGGAEAMVRAGQATIGLEWQSAADFDHPEIEPKPFRLYVDNSDPALAVPALALLELHYLRSLTETRGGAPPIHVIRLYNPADRHDWAVTPPLAGVIVMISMLLLGALTLVRERDKGTWEALLAMPVTAMDALLGKLLPYLLLGVMQASIVIGMAIWLFDLPHGSAWPALLGFTALYTFAHLCVGFAISALAEYQVQAIQGAVFFYLPSMLLSGFLYPFANMPAWAQAVGNMLPLTHFVRVARGVLLQNLSTDFVAGQVVPVLFFCLAAIAVALLAYRKRLR